MFSPSVEQVLTLAYREATSRNHAHLTVEHLLYAMAHDPEGEEILQACGGDIANVRRDLSNYLEADVDELPRSRRDEEPEQTLSFRRVLQTAVLHVQSAGRTEVRQGDLLAALLQEPRSHAAQLLAAQGITRLDVLNFISHGIRKAPLPGQPAQPPRGRRRCTRRGGGRHSASADLPES